MRNLLNVKWCKFKTFYFQCYTYCSRWHNQSLSCALYLLGVTCEPPPKPDNMEFKFPYSVDYKSEVTYKCVDGYYMNSSHDTITCQQSGLWTDTPICKRKHLLLLYTQSLATKCLCTPRNYNYEQERKLGNFFLVCL